LAEKNNKKRRVLFVGEASFLATGFATYWNEVIKRLHAKEDIECFEMGSYSRDDDPRCQQVPWKFYPVEPNHNNQEALNIYRSDPENQFGKWRFEDVCLDCCPDIVIDIRDFWMIDFINRSPYRDNYVNMQMPTIDGEPQKDKWIDGYRQADHIFTYSKYGHDLLKQYDGINLHGLASPAADIDVFKPVEDKDSHKQKLGIHPESIIIGTVMRNQARKLYYDLIEAFSQWINKTKRIKPDLAKKTFLYLHTSYPDVGYDIGKAIKEFKVGGKVLMTYICSECQSVYPSFFSGAISTCRNCKKASAHPPNASHHVPRKILADIMNLFDIYVQYSTCEGFGMPCLEAKSVGLPVMATNYSAMTDHINSPGGIKIDVGRFFYESIQQTEQKRALPDNNSFCTQLDKFLKMNKRQRQELSKKIREYVVEPVEVEGSDVKLPRCGWDRTAAIWHNIITTCDIKDRDKTWFNKKPNIHQPPHNLQSIDHNAMNNTEFIRWCVKNILGKPELMYSYFTNDLIHSLNCGFTISMNGKQPIDRNSIMNHFLSMVENKNRSEMKRLAIINRTKTDMSNANKDTIQTEVL